MTLKEIPYISIDQPDLIPTFCEMLAKMVEPETVKGQPAIALVIGGKTVATLVAIPLEPEMTPTNVLDSENTVVGFFERNLPELKHLALPFLNEVRGLGFPEMEIVVEDDVELIATRNNSVGISICTIPENLQMQVK